MSLITARKTGRGCSVVYMDVLFCRNRPRKMPCIHFFRVIAANSLKPSSINRALLLRKRRITGNWRLSVINAPVPLPFFFFFCFVSIFFNTYIFLFPRCFLADFLLVATRCIIWCELAGQQRAALLLVCYARKEMRIKKQGEKRRMWRMLCLPELQAM